MKPRLAVWKFSSCDGCQLTLLDCEDELLDIAEAVEIAYFLEATRTTRAGPYDVSLVEGSISTADEMERIQQIRRDSRILITHLMQHGISVYSSIVNKNIKSSQLLLCCIYYFQCEPLNGWSTP
ncbi:MAG TPA: hypothetical protein EYP07_00925 [Kiloniellaceae bacterium]|nr:hypothetical protein [Kiloniellaceae bacterium]